MPLRVICPAEICFTGYLWRMSSPPQMRALIRLLRPSRGWALLAVMLLTTGCLTIEEHYTFRKNGSGTMEYVVDMSAMRGMLEAMDGLGGAKKKDRLKGGDGGADNLFSSMAASASKLKALAGIKRVKRKTEKDGYVERLSFAFADLASLNRALNVLMPDSTGVQQDFFAWEGNTLVRANGHYAKKLGGDMSAGSDSLEMGQILESMKYKFSFAFASDVQDVGTAYGVVVDRPKPRRLELATDWRVIMKDPAALDLRITLEK